MPISRSYPDIRLEGIWKIANSFSQGSRYIERNFKRDCLEHKSEVIASKLTTSVIPGSISTATIDEK